MDSHGEMTKLQCKVDTMRSYTLQEARGASSTRARTRIMCQSLPKARTAGVLIDTLILQINQKFESTV